MWSKREKRGSLKVYKLKYLGPSKERFWCLSMLLFCSLLVFVHFLIHGCTNSTPHTLCSHSPLPPPPLNLIPLSSRGTLIWLTCTFHVKNYKGFLRIWFLRLFKKDWDLVQYTKSTFPFLHGLSWKNFNYIFIASSIWCSELTSSISMNLRKNFSFFYPRKLYSYKSDPETHVYTLSVCSIIYTSIKYTLVIS